MARRFSCFRGSVFGTSVNSVAAGFALLMLFGVAVCPVFGQVGGVYIDSKGMLRSTSRLSPDELLKVLRADSVGKPGTPQLAAGHSLRKVSLRRLESEVRKHHAAGKPLPADVRYLAGLTRIQYVFFFPEQNDVVLAGPAEGWKQLPSGEVVGNRSGRPVLHLEDLIVALRYAFTEKNRAPFLGCSIEPTPEGMRRHARYLRKLGGRFDSTRLRQIFAGMKAAMGPQAVKLYGVDESSRFALTMLAADYRLKRIAMAHDASPVAGVASYLDLASRRRLSKRQPQHRWWFAAHYDAILHTPDNLAFELKGQGVKVVTARTSSRVQKGGKKGKTPRAAPAAREFCESFTRHFRQMAQKVPVFAELQNLIALSVAAELVAQRYYGETTLGENRHWAPGHLIDRKKCPITKLSVPKQVPSLLSYRLLKGRHWLISVSGGVEINPTGLAGRTNRKVSRDPTFLTARTKSQLPKAPARWWWD